MFHLNFDKRIHTIQFIVVEGIHKDKIHQELEAVNKWMEKGECSMENKWIQITGYINVMHIKLIGSKFGELHVKTRTSQNNEKISARRVLRVKSRKR